MLRCVIRSYGFRKLIGLNLRTTSAFGIKRRMLDLLHVQFILLAAVFLLAGCRLNQSTESATSASPPPQNPVPVSSMRTVARMHWLGIKHLSGETNAAHLVEIWNLPESRRLERQTLDNFSLAPWRLWHRSIDTNAAALLRPLLDDVVEDESCLEIRQATNQPGELAFAIRLSTPRAALWQTNLARVLESLTDIHPVPAPDNQYGWSLKKHHVPNFIELTRAGEWTIVGAAQDHNDWVAELKSSIQRGQAPLMTGDTNDWLEVNLDPAQLVRSLTTFNFQLSTLNHFHLAVIGDGTNVLAHGTADFSKPLALDLQPWNIPTNLIDERLSSFTLLRGFQPWLASSKAWTNLQVGPSPDQICFWAQQGLPMQSYFAVPLPDASNEVDRLTDWVLQNQYHWFPTNDLSKFERSKEFNGLQWKGLPYMWLFLRSITVNNQNFVYGGGFPNLQAYPISEKWLQEVLASTNLVYYDSEKTGLRIEQWLYMGQFARFVTHKSQLPSDSLGMFWLKAIAPKLGYSVTRITETGPSQLSFVRRSSLGFTAVELNLLADWLESPQFPLGLHTLLAPPG